MWRRFFPASSSHTFSVYPQTQRAHASFPALLPRQTRHQRAFQRAQRAASRQVRERVVAGMEYARRHGTKSGNAIGRPKRIFDRGEAVPVVRTQLVHRELVGQGNVGVGMVAPLIQANASGHDGRSPAVPYAPHVCGNTKAILADMVATGADALELDYKTDVRLAHDLMKDPPSSSATSTPAPSSRSARPRLSRRNRVS